jgi:methylated-DNA-protein-cysteine methyltransferase-like protein
VVNAEGRTAPGWEEQRARLEAEGVPFRRNGRADLARAAWEVLREPAG